MAFMEILKKYFIIFIKIFQNIILVHIFDNFTKFLRNFFKPLLKFPKFFFNIMTIFSVLLPKFLQNHRHISAKFAFHIFTKFLLNSFKILTKCFQSPVVIIC